VRKPGAKGAGVPGRILAADLFVDRCSLGGRSGVRTPPGRYAPFLIYAAQGSVICLRIRRRRRPRAATVAELVPGIGRLTGRSTRFFATASGILLLAFTLSMTISTGIKSAFAYSVYSAAAAFVLAKSPKR
jgi:hypothetical protein